MAQPLNQEDKQAICDAVLQGRKIEAVRLYRDLTGADLKEAKEFIDELARQLGERGEEPRSAGRGCLTTAALCALAACAAAMWLRGV